MKKFSKFYFKSFDFDINSFKAKFYYCFDNEKFFEEIIDFNSNVFEIRKDLDKKIIENMLFHIHIALWISYYKLYPTKKIIVESGFLDDYQINFWNKFYINWLWEFFYKNKINPNWLINFINKNEKKYKKYNFLVDNKSLVAIWWWKDSIVTIEILKKQKIDFDLVVFWKIDKLKQYTSNVSEKKILNIKRQLSQNLFELNNIWYYNWHIPITWIIAFVLQFSCYLYKYKNIILSNERSANFENTIWKWIKINHQYSKSLEFEKDFFQYVNKYISSDLKYFSILRWLYETKIAELFSELWKKYFKYFSSCNNNFKINNLPIEKTVFWCNNCPKCIFVFIILRPYITKNEMFEIFWEDLYERDDLENLFRKLLWISWIKPFECVWEAEEVLYSMYLAYKNIYINSVPYILKIFEKEILINLNQDKIKNIQKKLVTIYNDDIIPKNLRKIILNSIK